MVAHWRWLCVLLILISSPSNLSAAFPHRIVSLAPNITETIYELHLEERLVGVTRFCNYPPAACSKPRMGGFANPSVEAILLAEPDIVVMTPDGNPFAVYKKLTRLGLKIHVFNVTSITTLPSSLEALGKALGAEERAKGLAISFASRLTALQAAAKNRGRLSAVCIIQISPLIVAGSGSHLEEAMMLLNLDNIAKGTISKYPKFSWEEIALKNPDVILLATNHKDMKSIPKQLTSLKAMRSNAVFAVSEPLLRLSPRLIDTLEELALALQPIKPNGNMGT